MSSLGWALASILGFNVTPEPALPERDDGEGHSAHVPMLMKSRTERTRQGSYMAETGPAACDFQKGHSAGVKSG